MRKKDDIFSIGEKPIPLASWQSGDEADARQALEESVRKLTHQLGSARVEIRELKQQQQAQQKKLLLEIIECIDGLNRVFANIESSPEAITPRMKRWIGNFRTVARQLASVLISQDVRRIEDEDAGTEFDPENHHVVEEVSDPNLAEGTITAVLKSGYILGDTILRKTGVRVVVAVPAGVDMHDTLRRIDEPE